RPFVNAHGDHRDRHSFPTRRSSDLMLGAPLIRYQVVEVRQLREKRLLAATRVMKAIHGEQFPLDGVMSLIEQCAGYGHPRVCEDHIPACLLLLAPRPYAFPVGHPSRGGDVVSKAA